MFSLPSASSQSRPGRRAGGTQAVLDHAPGLKDAVERVIAKLVKSLQTMAGASTTIEGMLAGLVMGSVKDVVTSHGPDGTAAILESGELGVPMVLMLDAVLVQAIVELLCGGNGVEPPPAEGRLATAIDIQFSQILFSLCAAAIQTEWAAQGFGGMRVTKIEGGLPADCLGARATEVAILKMSIGAFGLHGAMRLVLPGAALARFQHGGDDAVADSITDPSWSALLRREVGQAEVSLDAYIDARGLTLASLATLKVGQILSLPPEARERVSLVCDDTVFYRGELGQADDLYSLRIDEIVVDASKSPAIATRVARSSLNGLSKV